MNQYEQLVREVERLTRLKQAREEALRRFVYSRPMQGEAMRKSDSKVNREFVANGLIASDSLVREYQILIDRAVAKATMYRPGA